MSPSAVPPHSGNPGGPPMSPNQFLATVGRDLWEPMSNMVSMTGFLLETELTRDQHEMVAELRNSGDRVLRLIRDSLDAVEVEAGLVRPARIPFDLRVLADETVALLRGSALRKGMSMECRVHHEVPSRLVGDPGRLRQVLWNACKHAIETHASGGVVLRVSRLHEDPRSVTLRFDILSYGADMMGEPSGGERSASGTTAGLSAVLATGATGLRLEIARRLIGVMGTQLAVDAEPGRAPHAWFDLALEKQADAPSEAAAPPPRASLAGQRVLVVDPTEAIRHALASRLAQWGCRVEEAAQAEDAIAMATGAAAANDPYRFVLLDRDLPLMSAHEFGAHLRAQTGGDAARLIMFAAVGQRGDLEHARACGFDAYLPKPIDWQDLADALVEIGHMAAAGRSGDERRLVTRHWLAETRRARTRVLIVEDDAVSVLVTDWTLRRIGYQVVRVNSAGEMRRLFAGGDAPFDLVILALRLPDEDGLSLAREIRAATPEGRSTSIVALGYECTRVERDRCRMEGLDAYVARPVDLGHLCEIVERLTRTGLPAGAGAEDLYSNDENLPGNRRKSAAARDRVAVQFEVDSTTGKVLGGGEAAQAVLSALSLDDGLQASMDVTAAAVAAEPRAAARQPEPEAVPVAAGRAADATTPELDLARLDVTSMQNPSLRNGLLVAYLREANATMARLRPAISAGDAATTRSEAHRLSQMSEALGAFSCGEVFSRLEDLAREGSLAGAGALVDRASEELGRVERLASILGHGSSAAA